MPAGAGDSSVPQLREAVEDLHKAVSLVRNLHASWNMPPANMPSLPGNPSSGVGWNFDTFEKFINQRFVDLSMQLRERYEAQQTGVTAALAAAEKAVNAALIAAEKAVDKAEGAQQLRNEAQNEFRKSLSDLSGLMWTIKEGTLAVDSLRREMSTAIDNNAQKINALERTRGEATESLRKTAADATETLRKAMDTRISAIETGYANLQGRIWAVGFVWALVVVGISVAIKLLGH